MLEIDDIQHILLTRAPALTGRYEFLSFRDAVGGREWLATILEKVQSAAAMRASVDQNQRWVTIAFTWNGLRALGADEATLGTFPEEFKQGMVARAQMLGDTGEDRGVVAVGEAPRVGSTSGRAHKTSSATRSSVAKKPGQVVPALKRDLAMTCSWSAAQSL